MPTSASWRFFLPPKPLSLNCNTRETANVKRESYFAATGLPLTIHYSPLTIHHSRLPLPSAFLKN